MRPPIQLILFLTLFLFTLIFHFEKICLASSPEAASAAEKTLPKDSSGNLPKNLKTAFLAALKQSETIGIQREVFIQAEEGYTQALGALLPTVKGTGTFLRQEAPTNPTGGAISPASQNTIKITATQPLFQGFREFAALRQKKYLEGAQRFTLINTARELFSNLATAYYNYLALQQDEKNYLIEIEDSEKRLAELQKFYKIGRSQLTDVLTYQSTIASLENQLEGIRGQIAVTRETFTYLTGWNRDFELKDDETLTPTASLDSYLSKIESRPDVQSAKENYRSYEEAIPIAKSAHLPSLDLSGNYYVQRPGAALAGVNWDTFLSLNIPLFQGGIVQSQVRHAQSEARKYGLILSQTRRQAEQEIRSTYEQLVADQKQLQKLTGLVEIAKENYQTEIKYYRNGLVTNLDVIQSMTTFQSAQRQLDHQFYTVQADAVKLQAATGERPEINITPETLSSEP